MELWELSAREAIRETVAAYAHYADSGRFDELVELFAESGTLEVVGQAPLHGRDVIHEFLKDVAFDLAGASTSRRDPAPRVEPADRRRVADARPRRRATSSP